ncbi:MAG: dihydrodipicolinate synthase family protein [Bacteroidales bacterium]|jgi:4-hydroxy-tetrahydrodipicolinate synthase|nr:dihydrodipicolinate synthase family protein [Bacteroidales bacterium]
MNVIYPLKGIIPPLVTPLSDTDRLDVAGVEKLIEHVIAGGVHGLYILGTTGESPSLSHRLKKELIARTCRLVKRRIPVLVGVSDSSFAESIELSEIAAMEGATAVVITPSFYFLQGQSELLEYLQHIVPRMPLPVFYYNIPIYTKVALEPATAVQMAEIRQIVGIKDSSSNLAYFKQVQYLLKHRTDFSFLLGTEEYLGEFVLTGGHGGIPCGANLFPRLFVDLYHAAVNRDIDKIRALQDKIMYISTTIYSTGLHPSSFLKGLKGTLSLLGICSDAMAEPFTPFRAAERDKLKTFLQQLKVV